MVGILIGIVLIIASIGVLFTNEGRVDLSKIARSAAEVTSTKADTDPALNGKLVSASGPLSSNQLLGDDLYLKPGRYILVERKVEMYSWAEQKQSKKKKELGGSETEEITYDYKKGWTENPAPAGDFKYPEGHENPEKAQESSRGNVSEAKVGDYDIDPSMINFPAPASLKLNEQKVDLKPGAVLASARYIFVGRGTINAPQVGDLRISYYAIPEAAKVTVFGKLSDNTIVSYLDAKNNKLYRMFYGSRDDAIAAMQSEYKTMVWVMRIVGFIMMWIGLSLIFEPLSVLLDILPILGSINRFVFGVITFTASFVVSLIIIIVSIIVHNLIVLLLVLLLAAGLTFWYLSQKKKKA
jgi:hypothetical protein